VDSDYLFANSLQLSAFAQHLADESDSTEWLNRDRLVKNIAVNRFLSFLGRWRSEQASRIENKSKF
jgi:hypothetical protein